MLASGVEDLRFGMVLCDIATHVTGRPPIRDVRRGFPGQMMDKADCLHNLGVFLREFQRTLPEPLRLQADELYASEEALFQVLKFWAAHKDPGFMSGFEAVSETRPKRQAMELQSPGVSPRIPAVETDPPKEIVRKPVQQQVVEKPFAAQRPISRTPGKKVSSSSTPLLEPEEKPITPPLENRPLVRPLTTPVKHSEDTPQRRIERMSKPVSESKPPIQPRRNTDLTEHTSDVPLQPPRQSGLEIMPVSEFTKERLFTWLQSLNLVRKQVKIDEFPSLCTNGVLFCDLLNRLEGRTEVIKGVDRNPKNRTSVQANFSKALTFLRSFDKMTSRYLWATNDLVAGVEDVVWGLIEDIKALFKAKLVSLDANLPSTPTAGQRSRSVSKDKSATLTPSLSGAVSSRIDTLPTSPKSFRLPPRTPNARIPRNEDNLELSKPVTVQSSALFKGVNMDYQPLQVTKEMESKLKDWLAALKLNHLLGHENKHLLVDPLKNGVLLCELVGILEKTRLPNVNKTPNNTQAVRENVEKALCLLRERKLNIPLALLRQGEKIVQGNSKATWNLLWALMNAYPDSRQEGIEAPEPKSDLPYTGIALKRLEQSLVNWIYSLGVSGRAICPQDLNELLPDLRSGVMLCDLVSKVLPCQIPGVFRGPKSDSLAAANVRKALEPLRKTSRMSQQFVWKEKEVCLGDVISILGLLEDLHRYSDGLPARKRGPDYHKDGPYLGRQYSYKSYSSVLQTGERSDNSKAFELAHKQAAALPQQGTNLAQIESEESPVRRFRLNRMDQYAPPADVSEPVKVPYPRSSQDHFSQHHSDQPSMDLNRTFEMTDDRLFQWLDNIGVHYPPGLTLSSPEEFRNGVLFCQILETLTKAPVRGFTPHPKTTAAALNNTRKFLEHMRKMPGFPSRLFFVEEEVMRGNIEVVRELLKEVYRSFKHSIQSSIKINERVMKKVYSENSFRSRHNHSVS